MSEQPSAVSGQRRDDNSSEAIAARRMTTSSGRSADTTPLNANPTPTATERIVAGPSTQASANKPAQERQNTAVSTTSSQSGQLLSGFMGGGWFWELVWGVLAVVLGVFLLSHSFHQGKNTVPTVVSSPVAAINPVEVSIFMFAVLMGRLATLERKVNEQAQARFQFSQGGGQ